ncbi:aspartate 1-decarboxylase [Pigmentiphaga kullae]|uniref:Aspartate 1-decarboxylase n=1 Tax=Pigmentiphaga kullae TaxID=151784 RepID=A0A4Q7NN65_9BURK|nr:aspartate 1-decarboxylase [Pigmentiphaga kullae]RZS86502.1 L-aspartate 1-decarboxylase [Pigmentiphaga kullae]
MQRIMLRAKIHRVAVTQADLNYEGSCGIDEDFLDAAGMKEYERIELYNINNGERFSTYIIKGKRGSGEISLNGAAARRAHVGDLMIICTYGPMTDAEAAEHKPIVVLVDENNRIKEVIRKS